MTNWYDLGTKMELSRLEREKLKAHPDGGKMCPQCGARLKHAPTFNDYYCDHDGCNFSIPGYATYSYHMIDVDRTVLRIAKPPNEIRIGTLVYKLANAEETER